MIDDQKDSRQADPKNKTAKKEESIVNGQDDNSYDERDPAEVKTKEPATKETNSDSEFEYSESGEFDNQTHLTDTNSNEDYL